MITHYFEIKAIPQVEITQSTVIGYLLSELHKAIVPFNGAIGIGFPLHSRNRPLGGIIRVFSNEKNLNQLRPTLNQEKIHDYGFITNIEKVPAQIKGYRTYRRYRPKTHNDIKRKQDYLNQKGHSEAEIALSIEKLQAKTITTLPYAYIKSASTGQQMILFVHPSSLQSEPINNTDAIKFNSYGLSYNQTEQQKTVPIF